MPFSSERVPLPVQTPDRAAKVFRASVPVKELQANAAAAALDQAFGRVATDIVVWTLGQI